MRRGPHRGHRNGDISAARSDDPERLAGSAVTDTATSPVDKTPVDKTPASTVRSRRRSRPSTLSELCWCPVARQNTSQARMSMASDTRTGVIMGSTANVVRRRASHFPVELRVDEGGLVPLFSTRQNTDLPASLLRLVPIQSRTLPAVLFSGLDGVKSSTLTPMGSRTRPRRPNDTRCMSATTTAPTTNPITADAPVLTNQASTPPKGLTEWRTRSSAW